MKQYFVKYTQDDSKIKKITIDIEPDPNDSGETFHLIRQEIANKVGTKVYNIDIDSIYILN